LGEKIIGVEKMKKTKILFKTSKVIIEGELNNSQTALKIYEKLPLEAKVNTWERKYISRSRLVVSQKMLL